MKPQNSQEDFIDVQKFIDLFLNKWYYFVISVFICLFVALAYLKITPEIYQIEAKLQLKDQSISDNRVGPENLISGLGLLTGNPELEDEIGILSSYSLTAKALQRLDFDISYFSYPNLPLGLGKLIKNESYPSSLRIIPMRENYQLIGVPVYISFPDSLHYHVEVDADDAALYDMNAMKIVQREVNFKASQTLSLESAFVSDYLSFKLDMDSLFLPDSRVSYMVLIRNRNTIIENLVKKLEIIPITEGANIVTLTFKGSVVAKAKDYLSSLSEVYIENDLQKKNQLGVKTIEFIDRQLSSVVDSLKNVEGSLETFRESNNIMNVSTTAQNLNEQLQALEEERASLRVQHEYFEYTSDNLKNNETLTDIVAPSSVGVNDPFINNLLVQLAELNQEKAEKTFSSSSNSPVLRVLEQKIQRTKATILENFNNKISSSKIAIQENSRRIASIRDQINRLPASERDLVNIERKYSLNDNIYNYLLQKRAEAGIALASNQPDKSVVDYPRAIGDGPIEPKGMTILALALMVGLCLPVGLIWVQDLLNNNVREKDHLLSATNIPMIGMIPRADKKFQGINGSATSAITESFRFLRMALNQQVKHLGQTSRVIGLTSSQEGDGKTFCASNLAMSYAKSGRKTLLIGADLRKARLNEHFTLKEFGLAEYLEDQLKLEESIQSSGYNNLHIINAGRARTDIEILIESFRLEMLIDELKKHFDIIIVDTPPLGLVADYQSLSHLFDQHIFVVRHYATKFSIFKGVISKLPEQANIGLLLNDAEGPVVNEYGMNYGKNSYYTKAK